MHGEKGRRKEEAEKESKNDAGGPKSKRPKENMLAYWTPEVGNQPARVSLMSIPSRTVLRSKNLFNVTEVCSYCLRPGPFICGPGLREVKVLRNNVF